MDWFEQNDLTLDEPARELWRRAARRCRVTRSAGTLDFAHSRN